MFHIDTTEKPEDAYHRILEKVDAWTSQLKPAKRVLAQEPAKPAAPAKSVDATELHEPQPAMSTITGDDHYLMLPWKQSQKKSNLATILVTPEILEIPIARELFDKVKEWKTMKVGHITYRYSMMENGTEFLQKWSQVKLG